MEIRDKKGAPIQEGDYVYTRYRGGSHEGVVERVVVDNTTAAEEGVVNPPKVMYTDQHGHGVAHNPRTLKVQDK
ncbi:hypothetical protein ASPZODRAFT_75499 [Penicilliopsis zonata CBS 506.65]|uniref:Hypervirulence associated protein TUDOR domain-containing protein n=1 Tax=Penicilliopsis zonata CBS 506.65 TaxID=1073090 RepID=A0A1L9S758_9EURO|nr:hypothetical protein ASPZODRAFT_75499 [Penicilliopsis zonata CBS 506.65]OJJ42978.1 hypothetical protein ASPZODRAFT_75499 [Penicilliopsis zonata CBS 506.65]